MRGAETSETSSKRTVVKEGLVRYVETFLYVQTLFLLLCISCDFSIIKLMFSQLNAFNVKLQHEEAFGSRARLDVSTSVLAVRNCHL